MTATDKYLARYAEPEATVLLERDVTERWHSVLVVPAYDESPQLLANLKQFSSTLLILVLNRPDTDSDSTRNDALRGAVLSRGSVWRCPDAFATLTEFSDDNHVLLLERPAPLASRDGVGLARKLGCDIALALQKRGVVRTDWIHCTDGDALLPQDYFTAASQHADAIALTYPFAHDLPSDARERDAMRQYEAYLRHYVRGLEYAGSPYAFFTLGSCLAVKADAYAKARGFPKRAGGEDFYLLNKLAKLGAVETPRCDAIRLSPRLSQRVPFGTGPALRKLLDDSQSGKDALFYHPETFENLRALLQFINTRGRPDLDGQELLDGLKNFPELRQYLSDHGLDEFLRHAREHCADAAAFKKQFHQWFDGFRTLKLIHGLSEHWGRLTLEQYREATQ